MVINSRTGWELFLPLLSTLLFLSMLVAVPAQSQSGGVAATPDVEVINNDAQTQIAGYIVFLFAQAFVLVAVMISYLRISNRHTKENHGIHGHWRSRLRFHH